MLNVEVLGLRQIEHDWTPAAADAPLARAVLAAGIAPDHARRILDGLLALHVKVTITTLHGDRIKCDKPPAWPVWGKATQTVITVDGVTTSETKWDRTIPERSDRTVYNEQDGVRIKLETARGRQTRFV
jgi:hypothetical protein